MNDDGHYGTALGGKPPRDRRGRFAKPDAVDFALASSQGNWRKAYGYAADRRQAEVTAAVRKGLANSARTYSMLDLAWLIEHDSKWMGDHLITVYAKEFADIRAAWREQHA